MADVDNHKLDGVLYIVKVKSSSWGTDSYYVMASGFDDAINKVRVFLENEYTLSQENSSVIDSDGSLCSFQPFKFEPREVSLITDIVLK